MGSAKTGSTAVDWRSIDQDALAFLVAPESAEAFLQSSWEQKPALFEGTPQRKALFAGLANQAAVVALLAQQQEEGQPLEHGEDIKPAWDCCTRGEKHSHHHHHGEGEEGQAHRSGPVTSEGLDELLKEESSGVALCQPQRLLDPLWRLVAALETRLGCLAGCEAVLMPRGARGLPPHYDGVESWVVQTEGSSSWQLSRPAAGSKHAHCTLANAGSAALGEEDVGERALETTLEAGDVLYIPRGTIQQSSPASNSHSAYLVFSTYKRWSWADLMQYSVSVALANPQLQPLLPATLKAGLPPAFHAATALTAAGAAAVARDGSSGSKGEGSEGGTGPLEAQLAAVFRSMADCLEGSQPRAGFASTVLRTAADAMAEDFICSRLPPHPEQLLPQGAPPMAEGDVVACRGPASLFRVVPLAAGEGPDEGGDPHSDSHAGPGSLAGGWVRLMSCLPNKREGHMMSSGEDEDGHPHGHSHAHAHHAGSESGEDEEEEAAEEQKAGGKKNGRAAEEGSESIDIGSESSDDDDEEEEEEEEEQMLEELLKDEEEESQEDLVFPAEFAPALVQLLSSTAGTGVCVRDIALPARELRLQLAAALWEAGVLATLPQSGKAGRQQKAGKSKAGAGTEGEGNAKRHKQA